MQSGRLRASNLSSYKLFEVGYPILQAFEKWIESCYPKAIPRGFLCLNQGFQQSGDLKMDLERFLFSTEVHY
jgi:hypothetical protein